ncbi:MAG: GrpB family protein [Rubrobacteraceae bacterium]
MEYDSSWPARFEEERVRIEEVIGRWMSGIEHVGSTAVPGLDAKPVIDVMVGLGSMADADRCVEPLISLGYSYWEEGVEPYHRLFAKFVDAGWTARTHNLHLVETGGWYWKERLLFRDQLRGDPDTAREYARLKRELAQRFRDDREAYTAAKAAFVAYVVGKARKSQA